jgi:hypothetical protein
MSFSYYHWQKARLRYQVNGIPYQSLAALSVPARVCPCLRVWGRWLPRMAATAITIGVIARRNWGENSIYLQHEGGVCGVAANVAGDTPRSEWKGRTTDGEGGAAYLGSAVSTVPRN